jgi:LEA14-like dessication related protein
VQTLRNRWGNLGFLTAGAGGAAILTLLLLLSGCGVRQLARGEIQPPRVSFKGLAIYQPTSAGWPLGATLVLENPNPQPLNLLGYDYDLSLEGKSVAQGTSQEAVSLPAGGQTVTQFPILVKLPALMGLLPAMLQHPNRKLHYQIAGSFRLTAVMGGLIPIPFRFGGELAPKEGMEFLRPYLR